MGPSLKDPRLTVGELSASEKVADTVVMPIKAVFLVVSLVCCRLLVPEEFEDLENETRSDAGRFLAVFGQYDQASK